MSGWYKVRADGSVIDVVHARSIKEAIEIVINHLLKIDKSFTPKGTIWTASGPV